jgi:hypothetical protein
MPRPKRKAFVAYASRDEAHAEAVLDGARRANALEQPYDYHPWQFNDIAGQPLISPILENIDESALIVADITFLNLNVVYEIGYAIGKKKRAFLVRIVRLRATKRWPERRAFSTRWATWSMPTLRDCLLA